MSKTELIDDLIECVKDATDLEKKITGWSS